MARGRVRVGEILRVRGRLRVRYKEATQRIEQELAIHWKKKAHK